LFAGFSGLPEKPISSYFGLPVFLVCEKNQKNLLPVNLAYRFFLFAGFSGMPEKPISSFLVCWFAGLLVCCFCCFSGKPEKLLPVFRLPGLLICEKTYFQFFWFFWFARKTYFIFWFGLLVFFVCFFWFAIS